MTQDASLDDMDKVAKEEIQSYINKVMEVTQGLKAYFKEWNKWEKLWENICLDIELLNLLKEKSPRKQEFNMKMVCNVVGIYAETKLKDVPKTALNNALHSGNMRNYISNHCAYNTTDTTLTKELYERIKGMIQ